MSTQYRVSNPGGREAVLDIYAEGSDGTIYNIEIQRWKKGSEPERPRFHEAVLTKDASSPGDPFPKLADVRGVFLTEKDFVGQGWAGYATPDILVRLDQNATKMTEKTLPVRNSAKTSYLNGEFYEQGGRGTIGDLMRGFG